MPAREIPVESLIGRMVRSEMQVGFTHCDPYGHMNTAAYLDVAINHRMTEVIQLIGLDVMALREERGITWLIRRVEMELMEPAGPGEWLTLESWIEDVQPSRMRVIVKISRRESGRTCARVTFTSATFNSKKGVLVQVPKSYPCRGDIDFDAMPWAEGHPRPQAAS